MSLDASANLIGAVLLQSEQPLAYATKTLNEAQRKYSQIEKEVYAIRYACIKFYEYTSVQTSDYRNRSQITDHKPLETISSKPIEKVPARLQRIIFDELQYSPIIMFRKGAEIPIADALSRDFNHSSDEEQQEETF